MKINFRKKYMKEKKMTKIKRKESDYKNMKIVGVESLMRIFVNFKEKAFMQNRLLED